MTYPAISDGSHGWCGVRGCRCCSMVGRETGTDGVFSDLQGEVGVIDPERQPLA